MIPNQSNLPSTVVWKHSSTGLPEALRAPLFAVGGERPISTMEVAREQPVAPTIVVIEKRSLLRECLTHAIRSVTAQKVLSYSNLGDWLNDTEGCPISVTIIVLCTGAGTDDAEECRQHLSLLSQSSRRIAIVLLSDQEDPDRIVEALEQGARGYILTSAPLDVAIEAMRLVGAGGTFVPASSFVQARRSGGQPISSQAANIRLTTRQMAVVSKLRQGKANKVIAYELNMRESTVKVHVRNIMKKFNAHNRTEVAFIANGLPGFNRE
jgi:DNA-binding NarL/FixJ family response regulator